MVKKNFRIWRKFFFSSSKTGESVGNAKQTIFFFLAPSQNVGLKVTNGVHARGWVSGQNLEFLELLYFKIDDCNCSNIDNFNCSNIENYNCSNADTVTATAATQISATAAQHR